MKNNRPIPAQGKTRALCFLIIALLLVFGMGEFTKAQQSHYVLGRIMVKFDYDEVELPSGVTDTTLNQINVRSTTLKQALQRFQIDRVTRIFPSAVKGDTVRFLSDGTKITLTDFFDIYLLKFPENVAIDSVITALQKLRPVIYAEPDQFVAEDAQPNDQLYPQQWHLEQANDKDIDAGAAWDLSKGDNIKIAIVDRGVRISHDDLDGKIQGGETTTSLNHGTQVAGVAAAETNNTEGIAGVGWNSKIIPYNSGETLSGYITDLNAATAAGAHVINMSWSTQDYSQSLKDALDNAAAQGITLIKSAANNLSPNGMQSPPFIAFPQAFSGLVTSVSATTSDDLFRDGWNYGYFVDLTAPGVGIWTTDYDNDQDYISVEGTSFSTPVVSGVAALLRSFSSNLIDRDFERIMELSADTVDFSNYPYGPDKWNDRLGHGRVNAHKALQLVSTNSLYHWTASGGSVNTSTYGGWWFRDLPGAPGGYYVGYRKEVRKTVTFSQIFNSTPQVWGRINGTIGYNTPQANSCYSIPYCEPVPGTVTTTGATLRTYVYEISLTGGQYYGWYPAQPANVAFAYSALGVPQPLAVTITGPSILQWKVQGTWTANPSGGNGSYAYEWRFRQVGDPNWSPVASTSQNYTRAMLPEDMELQVKVTSQGLIVYDTHYVEEGMTKTAPPSTEENTSLPENFSLSQNYPNPFNPETSIRFGLPEEAPVQLVIFDLVGREVRRLVDRSMPAGYHEVIWNGKDNLGNETPSGVYLYQISAGQFHDWKKLALVR